MTDTNSLDSFDPLSRSSAAYAQKCSELSDLLGRVQKFLRDSPGKMAITYNSDGGSLKFCRHGSGWHLVYSESPLQTLQVTSAPVEVKIKAASMLPGLFQVLREAQEAKLAEVSEAIDALRKLPFIASECVKEGKK